MIIIQNKYEVSGGHKCPNWMNIKEIDNVIMLENLLEKKCITKCYKIMVKYHELYWDYNL